MLFEDRKPPAPPGVRPPVVSLGCVSCISLGGQSVVISSYSDVHREAVVAKRLAPRILPVREEEISLAPGL